MKSTSLFLILGLIWSIQTLAAPTRELEECQTAQDRFFSGQPIQVSCEENFFHYLSNKASGEGVAGEIVVANFNLFHLGDNMSQFKDYDLIAAMAAQNKWDILGAIEVMPTPKLETELNTALDELIANPTPEGLKAAAVKTAAQLKSFYVMPGHLRLLKALQAQDPSWSLIISPRGEGESATNLERAGFYYRAGRVSAVDTKFCGSIACYGSFEKSSTYQNIEELYSRPPFLASFESGEFSATLFTMHARFRPPKDPAVLERMRNEIFEGTAVQNISADEVPRFMETKLATQLMNHIAKTGPIKNVILMGDFNLEMKATRKKAWEDTVADLPGASVLVETSTSISDQNGLANNYDHLIFSPEVVEECDAKTAKSFEYLDTATFPTVTKYLVTSLKDPKIKRMVADFVKKLKASRALKKVGTKTVVAPLTAAEITEQTKNFTLRMIQSQSDPKNKFAIFKELVSDHLPIQMTCRTSPNLLKKAASDIE